MRVLIAPDNFVGMLTSVQAAGAMAEGWRRGAPEDEVTLAPMSAGQAGFVDVVEQALGGTSVGLTVSDPLGRQVPATILFTDGGGVRTAYLEAASAAGLHLLGAPERNPAVTSSYGVGQMIDAARSEGAERIVVACGGVGSNDAGAGMLAALGAGPSVQLSAGGGVLGAITAEHLEGLPLVRERFAGVDVVAAVESSMPLLGLSGTSALASPEMGASPELAQQLERHLGHFVDQVERVLPPPTDLFTGLPRRLERQPGAGAGGGIGYALFVLGGRAIDAVRLVLDTWDTPELLRGHDLVLTGEAVLDARSIHSGVVLGVAQEAQQFALPTVVLAGQVIVGRRESMTAGVSAVYSIVDRTGDIAEAMADPIGALVARTERLARTWSR